MIAMIIIMKTIMIIRINGVGDHLLCLLPASRLPFHPQVIPSFYDQNLVIPSFCDNLMIILLSNDDQLVQSDSICLSFCDQNLVIIFSDNLVLV